MSEKGFFEYPFKPGDKVVMVKNYNHEIGTVKKCYGASGFLTLTKIPYSCDIVFADKREKNIPWNRFVLEEEFGTGRHVYHYGGKSKKYRKSKKSRKSRKSRKHKKH